MHRTDLNLINIFALNAPCKSHCDAQKCLRLIAICLQLAYTEKVQHITIILYTMDSYRQFYRWYTYIAAFIQKFQLFHFKLPAHLHEQYECANNYFSLIASLLVLYMYCARCLGRLPCIRRKI